MSLPPVPHAALLIDFDNVTMGIRSDLSKELKSMLSSEIIKGKVAVQRAYADWRRYPQYIVPLAESSVDLIFAPAYGSSKKNATDIRLAIDALELVFTRPEIGTFILLSGDSDFSSLVLKLKEYGKYVIGVGIRESASDLLVQNCDEYYSYSALTGLTKAGEEPATTAEDPWELVELAIKQMAESNDVMRSDRLKQVILEMDPSFDEKTLGFQKFNRFMQEAAGRGLVSLKKLENGQFEVGLPGVLHDVEVFEEQEQKGNGRRRTRRGRGGRDRERGRDREPTADREPIADHAAELGEDAQDATVAALEPALSEAPVVAAPIVEPASVRVSAPASMPPGEPSITPASAPAAEAAVAPVADPAPAAEPVPAAAPQERARRAKADAAPAPAQRGRVRDQGAADPLRDGYGLLRRAVSDVVGRGGEAARDSDIKRRMLELQEGWDESVLGFSKFSRFLRQAHDAEVINLRKLENGAYEAVLTTGGGASEPEPRGRDRDRGRGRGRERERRPEVPQRELELVGERAPGAAAAAAEPATQATTPASAPLQPGQGRPVHPAPRQRDVEKPAAASAAPTPAAAASAAPGRPATPPAQSMGIRRGSRGRAVGAAPPPLLEGQTVSSSRASSAAAPAAAPPQPPVAPVAAVEPVAAEAAPAETGRGRAGSGKKAAPAKAPRGGAGKAEPRTTPAAKPAAEPKAAAAPRAAPAAKGRAGAKAASEPKAAPEPEAAAEPGLATLGLPSDAAEVVTHLTSYPGVGPKSVQSLVEAFGAAHVFEALHGQPDRVREIVGGARGERLLEAWQQDFDKRLREHARKGAAKKSARGRRGGRGGRRGKSTNSEA